MLHKIMDFATGTKRRLTITLITGLFLIAIAVCVICDLFTGGGLSWSLVVIGPLLYAWPVLWLLICKRRHKLAWATAAACALAVPLLLWIGRAIGAEAAIRALGAPIAYWCIGYAALTLLATWCLRSHSLMSRLGAAVLLLIPLAAVIHGLCADYAASPYPLPQVLVTCAALACAALLLFVPGSIRKDLFRRKKAHLVQQAEPTPEPPKAVEAPKGDAEAL